MYKKINLIVLFMSLMIVSCGPSEAELKAIEEARQVEVAKCVRYNADIVYQQFHERYKKTYGDMDDAMNRLSRSLGSYKRSNMIKQAAPDASEKRKLFMPFLKEMCEESLLFIFDPKNPEIPERFHEQLGLQKIESTEN